MHSGNYRLSVLKFSKVSDENEHFSSTDLLGIKAIFQQFLGKTDVLVSTRLNKPTGAILNTRYKGISDANLL